jgi:hypothetical protein
MTTVPPNNSMQRTALRAAADAGRYTAGLSVGHSRKVISWTIQNLI